MSLTAKCFVEIINDKPYLTTSDETKPHEA